MTRRTQLLAAAAASVVAGFSTSTVAAAAPIDVPVGGGTLATSRFWTNAAGGNWDQAANWSPNGAPGPFDDIHFEAGGTYDVNVGNDAAVHNINVEADYVTLNLGGHTLSSAGEVSISPGFGTPPAALNVTNGTLSRPTAQDLIIGHRSNGAMNVNNGGNIYGPTSGLIVGRDDDATLDVQDGTITTLSGHLAHDPALAPGATIGGGGLVTLGAGGTWYVGAGGFSAGRNGWGKVVVAGGQLDVLGATKIYDQFGSGIDLIAGTFRTGSLDTSGNPFNFNWTGGTLRMGGPLEVGATGPLGADVSVAAQAPEPAPGKTLICDDPAGVHVAPGAQLDIGPGGYVLAPIVNDGLLTQTGGTTTLTGDGGLVGNGTTIITAGTINAMRIRQMSLNISGTGRILLPYTPLPGTNINCRTGPISISGSGKLDLSEKRLILVGASLGSWNGSAYTGTTGLIQSGRNGGPAGTLWQGSGIVTSQPDASAERTTLAIATAQQALGITSGMSALWSGEFVSSTTLLVMYTWAGDANLDGTINPDDYANISFNDPNPAATGYANGDFNYDGDINADDFSLIDFNFNAQGAPFPTGGAVNAVTSVPEPASAVGLFVAACLTPRRRRTRHRG